MENFIKTINIEKYYGKGGTSKFIKEYGEETYIKILNFTSEFSKTKSVNKKLTARLYFVKHYNSNIDKIIKNNLSFNGKFFIKKSKTPTKKSWDNLKEKLKIIEEYSKKETITLLKKNNLYLNFLGKSKNRTLYKNDIKLFKSIYTHTKFLDDFNSNYNKLTHRILFLIFNYNIKCECGNTYTWKINENKLDMTCKDCSIRFPTILWFKKKYGDSYQEEYNNYFKIIKNYKTNSLPWYIKKYGENDGKKKYYIRYKELGLKLSILKKNKYSKISQELFNQLISTLDNRNEIYFHDFNKEYVINIPRKYNTNKVVFFIDFKYKNKIIEYNGIYWHNKKDDTVREKILNKMGYDVMNVSSDEYNRNKKPKKIIENLIKFLKNADK